MKLRLVVPVLLCLLFLSHARADSKHEENHDEKHDVIRTLREHGDILPLEDILKRARNFVDGRVIETEMEIHQNRYIYEIEMLDQQGYVQELRFDAKTGEHITEDLED